MTVTQGSFRSYDYNRMVVLFTVMDEQTEIACAISTAAMDDIDGTKSTKPEQREAQYMRLRARIDARAEAKVLATEFEGNPPSIVLRSIDFRT